MNDLNLKMKRTKKWIAILLLLTIAFVLLPTLAQAASYPYIDENGAAQNSPVTTVDYTGGDLAAGWYYVAGTVTETGRITVSGDVKIILADGCHLDAQSGIRVEGAANSLTIYSQTANTGELTATGNDGAGIGGNNVVSGTAGAGGNINIYGGSITAIGSYESAGIGGGGSDIGDGGAGGTIIIGGNAAVTAIGSAMASGGAGIGGGGCSAGNGGASGTIIINTTGTVIATGGVSSSGKGADIGAGEGDHGNGAETPGLRITSHPSPQTVMAGSNAEFSVTATDATAYQWMVSTDGGITWSDVSGETAATLYLTGVTAAMSGNLYKCHATGAPFDYSSQAALLTVNTPECRIVGGDDYATLSAALAAVTDGQTIEILKNITLGTQIIMPAGISVTITSDASGPYTILRGVGSADLITVPSGASLTLANITIDANNSGTVVRNEGTLTIGTGATLQGGYVSGNGGGVYNTGTVHMTGGVIQNNNASFGGGVYNTGSGAVFNMNDGSITGNSVTGAGTWGGGVFNYNQATFNMSGGSITGNSAPNGGGVYIAGNPPSSGSSFNMSGGSITDNTAAVNGAGVIVINAGVITVSGEAQIGTATDGNAITRANDTRIINIGEGGLSAGARINISPAIATTDVAGTVVATAGGVADVVESLPHMYYLNPSFVLIADGTDIMLADPDNVKGLTSIAGQDVSTLSQTGTSVLPVTGSVNVPNSKSTLGLTDIVHTGASFNLYSDVGFTTEITGAGTIPLTSSSATTVYIKVTAIDTTEAFYAITINCAPDITGPTSLTLTTGYSATSSGTFSVTGAPAPTVTKISGNPAITWNSTTKQLDIAAGLTAGIYPVTLEASNGIGTDATITFTLTVNDNPITAAAITITAPAIGNTPDTTAIGTGDFSIGTVSWSGTPSTFAGGTVYTATVTLSADTGHTFTGLTTATINGQAATVTNNIGTAVTLSYTFPQTDAVINSAALTITAPAIGDTPNTTAIGTGNFSIGTVSWSGTPLTFAGGTVYTATVTLSADTGHTFTGLTTATINGQAATVTSNIGTAVTLSYTFPQTDAVIDDAAVILAVPTAGATPETAITETAQYTGTVTWVPAAAAFDYNTTYTATITLTPKTGYTLTGVSADFFTVTGAATVTNGADSGIITATFPSTGVRGPGSGFGNATIVGSPTQQPSLSDNGSSNNDSNLNNENNDSMNNENNDSMDNENNNSNNNESNDSNNNEKSNDDQNSGTVTYRLALVLIVLSLFMIVVAGLCFRLKK